MHVHGTEFSGTIGAWPRNVEDAASLMHTPSPAFDLDSSSKASSVTTGHGSFASRDGEKNGLRYLRESAFWLVRSAHTSSSRPAQWRYAGVPGDRGSAGRLPELRRGEGRAVGFSLREPLLHRAVCLLRGGDDAGRARSRMWPRS